MKKINVRYLWAAFFGVIGLVAAGPVSAVHTFGSDIPEAEDPDACKGSSEPEECKRWYYLTEAKNPDAWNYTQRNREEQKRWYKIERVQHVGVEPSRIIVLEGVNFNFNKADLRSDALPILQKNAEDLKSTSRIEKVKIVGHTDAIGSAEYNKELSEKRAESVKNYLVGQGVGEDLLFAEGRGEEDPVAPNKEADGDDDPDGRAKNRRVELHIWDSYAGRD